MFLEPNVAIIFILEIKMPKNLPKELSINVEVEKEGVDVFF